MWPTPRWSSVSLQQKKQPQIDRNIVKFPVYLRIPKAKRQRANTKKQHIQFFHVCFLSTCIGSCCNHGKKWVNFESTPINFHQPRLPNFRHIRTNETTHHKGHESCGALYSTRQEDIHDLRDTAKNRKYQQAVKLRKYMQVTVDTILIYVNACRQRIIGCTVSNPEKNERETIETTSYELVHKLDYHQEFAWWVSRITNIQGMDLVGHIQTMLNKLNGLSVWMFRFENNRIWYTHNKNHG